MQLNRLFPPAARYLLLEFPCLLIEDPPQRFVEIGCGCGSSVLPVLKANQRCHVIATDLSPTAITMLKTAANSADLSDSRITAYAADGANLMVEETLAGNAQVLNAFTRVASA